MDVASVEKSLERKVVSPVYLFFGEESYLAEQLMNKFVLALLTPETRDFNMDILDGREKPLADIVNHALTLPFMSEKRLVIVREPSFLLTKKAGEATEAEGEEVLLNYLENPEPATCLIFITSGSVDKRKKAFKLIEKKGQVVDFTPLKGPELNQWIVDYLKKEGVTIAREALQTLLLSVGNKLRALTTEMDKLIIYKGRGGEITLEDIEVMVAKSGETNVFKLVDSVAEKRYKGAMAVTQELLFTGETPLKIQALLARQFRIIWQVKLLNSQGYTEKDIANQLSIPHFLVPKAISQGRNFSDRDLAKAFKTLIDMEFDIKTGRMDPKLSLEVLIARLCKGY